MLRINASDPDWKITSRKITILPEEGKLAAVTADISEQKIVINALSERNAILDSVLESTHEPVFALDRNYCYTGFNRAHAATMKALFGAEIKKYDSLEKYQNKTEWQATKKNLDRALQGETLVESAYSNHAKKHNRRYFETKYNPIHTAAGEIIGVSVFVHDITERKQAEEALENYSARLASKVAERTRELRQAQERIFNQEKLAAMGQMAGGISHELRNPLGVISLALYTLKLALPNPADNVKEYLDIIGREVQTAEKIIHDLLDFSRIKAAERQSVETAGLVQQLMERLPAPANITVSLEFSSGLPSVCADLQHVGMILHNLVSNAYQAMPEGGKLTISATRSEDHANAAIRVTDTGVGISAENRSKLFEPLFTTKPSGVGLGLVVCQKLAEANDGRIEVQSEPGKGSTFTLYLPVHLLE